jgi:hypothetical protein
MTASTVASSLFFERNNRSRSSATERGLAASSFIARSNVLRRKSVTIKNKD